MISMNTRQLYFEAQGRAIYAQSVIVIQFWDITFNIRLLERGQKRSCLSISMMLDNCMAKVTVKSNKVSLIVFMIKERH